MTAELAAARLGFMTASVAAKIMGGLTTDGLASLVQCLAWERVHGDRNEEGYQSAAMKRGNEVEEFALDTFVFERELFGLKRGAFIKHPTIPWVGCSPDGIYLREARMIPVEVKSLLVPAFMDVLETQKVPATYQWQCRWQAWCCGNSFTEFVAWHPARKPIIIQFPVTNTDIAQMTERAALVEARIRSKVELLRARQ
jgi:hypothetical protein